MSPSDRFTSRGFYPALFCGLAYSLLSFLALPVLRWWFFSLVALAPIAWAVARVRGSERRIFLGLMLGAIPLWLVQQWWAWGVTKWGMIPMVLILASFPALAACIARRLHNRAGWPLWLALAAAWSGVEYFRGEWFGGGYAWGFIAHPLIDSEPARILGSAIGVYGLGFVLAAISGAGLELALARRGPNANPSRRFLASRAAVFAGCVALTIAAMFASPQFRARIPSDTTPRATIDIAAVQTNIPQGEKLEWSLENQINDYLRFQALTIDAAALDHEGNRPDLIVWPETMLPGATLEPAALKTFTDAGLVYDLKVPMTINGVTSARVTATAFAVALHQLQATIKVPMLVGSEGLVGARVEEKTASELGITDLPADQRVVFVRQDKRFNSIYLVQNGVTQPTRYDKIRRTPYGEYFPLLERLPALRDAITGFAASGARLDLSAGTRPVMFEIPLRGQPGSSALVATPICFEIVNPGACRRLVFGADGKRTDAMVNPSNDGWFGASVLAREQHLIIARWRCVETATPMVRSANTGISATINARGDVLARVVSSAGQSVGVDGFLRSSVELARVNGKPLASRMGDAPGIVPFLAMVLGLAWSVRPRLKSAARARPVTASAGQSHFPDSKV